MNPQAVLAWQDTINAAWQKHTAAQGGPNIDAARDAFFGAVPPGARRKVIQTNATVPGGQDGIVLSRFYIADQLAAYNQLYGDNRGPSTDPAAASRFDLAWDTRTGEVSITVHPSTQTETSVFQEQSPFTEPRKIDAWPVNVGPDSLGTNFANNFVVNGETGKLDVKYDLINSGLPDLARFGAVQGHTTLSVDGDDFVGTSNGEDYPDREVIQYTPEGSRMLHTRPMSPSGSNEVFGNDYDTPVDNWRAPR
jgi:hypothetical protein